MAFLSRLRHFGWLRGLAYSALLAFFFPYSQGLALAEPADPATTSEAQQHLRQLFDALASGDPKRVGPMLAPEFQLVRADGSAYNKDEYLRRSIPKILTTPEFADLVVTRHGASVVVRLKLIVREYLNGREAQSGSAQLFVFRIQPDGWKVVASANFAQPISELPKTSSNLPTK